MEKQSSRAELINAIEAIKSSDVVENRAQLISQLCDLEISEKSDASFVLESLTILWEDFTCLDVSQCVLNKAILQVAAKFIDRTSRGGLAPFLTIVTKASIWCRKHLQMTIMSMEESQEEEHSNIFYKLLLDVLTFCSASVTALMEFSPLKNEIRLDAVESSILEQLNLTKDVLSETERIQSCSSEILKAAHTVIDSIIKLCGNYCQSVNHEDTRCRKDQNTMDIDGGDGINCIAKITRYTIEKLCELGTLAANGGGNLVSILNVSWKGVVTLVQVAKAALEVDLYVVDIILTLISLADESLRCAAENWFLVKESISKAEARRAFVPVKFYLVHALKISLMCPCQAYHVHRQLAQSALMIVNLKILMCNEEQLKVACEVLSEVLDQTAMSLPNSLLSSGEVKQEMKFEILNSLFTDEGYENFNDGNCTKTMEKILSLNWVTMSAASLLSLGQILLFVYFLRHSLDLEDIARLGIIRKLGWLFNMLVNEEIYPSVLSLLMPQLHGAKKTQELVWEPMFASLLQSLKAFVIVTSSSSELGELEDFLLDNFFHPHFLCWEIVMELWCFMLRYAEAYAVNDIIDKLCSCLKLAASTEDVFIDDSVLRKVARSITRMVSYGAKSYADRVYEYIIGDGGPLLTVMYLAMLLEGFSLDLLSDSLRGIARQSIINSYHEFVRGFDGMLVRAPSSSLLGAPVFMLAASLASVQVIDSNIDEKTLKFLVATISSCISCSDNIATNVCLRLLGQTLGIVSNMNHLYACNGMEEVILGLQNLFISGPLAVDTQLYQRKVDLVPFMGGLGHMEIEEKDESPKCSAIWELYHMLLRERHWAFVHLAIKAFGHFAERTLCNQLWRFVPQDAALSYGLSQGTEVNEDRFMSEFKKFLERKTALLTIAPCTEQLQMLRKEASILKVSAQIGNNLAVKSTSYERTEAKSENRSKKRKIPDEIGKGVELLQSGLKVISDGLSQWEKNDAGPPELHDKFIVHFACLEDAITHLAGLTRAD